MLVLCQESVAPLCAMRARAIGMMRMVDERGEDDKIIAVHLDDAAMRDYGHIDQLPPHALVELKRFFEDYKQLEHKRVEVRDFDGPDEAVREIRAAAAEYTRRYGAK